MPYDVVGNAAGLNTGMRNVNANSGYRNLNRGYRHRHIRSGGGSLCQMLRAIYCITFLLVLGGFFCVYQGMYHLLASTTDSRGAMLKQWYDAMNTWTTGAEITFESLRPSLTTNYAQSPKVMTGIQETITPADFGDTSWSTSKIKNPVSVSAYSYSGTAQCPGPNKDCTLQLTSATSGKVIATRKFQAAMQHSEHMISKTSMCQWYDSDWNHPMAAIGIGHCNNQIPPGTGSQVYNYGPSECVADHFLDINGCPNDVILTSQLVQAGWDWAGNPIVQNAINKKPRFTYDQGKCWDYTDCFCTGCGFTFKTDVSKGWGFTGYGYFYNNVWTQFPKPFSQMSGTEKAQQCARQLHNMGRPCPAQNVNLVCFRAGGYPKKKCSTWCRKQDPTAAYVPPHWSIEMNDYYGPWGHQGTYPTYKQEEAQCNYIKTSTSQVSEVAIRMDESGTSAQTGGASWAGTQFVEQTVTHGNTPLPDQPVPVSVLVRSEAGPIIQGRTITDGCGPVVASGEKHPSKSCFGKTQGENFASGLAYLIAGIIMVGAPFIFMVLTVKGVISCFSAASRPQGDLYVPPQQSYVPPMQPASVPVARPL